MLWSQTHQITPRISGIATLLDFCILMVMKAIRLVATIWISVLTNPLPMRRLMMFTDSLVRRLLMIYKIFSTAPNHNPTTIQKKMRLLGFGSLSARNRLFPAEYFMYSSAYAEIK